MHESREYKPLDHTGHELNCLLAVTYFNVRILIFLNEKPPFNVLYRLKQSLLKND